MLEVTQSEITTFKNCRMKWYLNYVSPCTVQYCTVLYSVQGGAKLNIHLRFWKIVSFSYIKRTQTLKLGTNNKDYY